VGMGNRLDGLGSNAGNGKFLLFSTASRPAIGPIQPPIQCVPREISPGVNWPGHEADDSPPSSAEVKNGGAIPPPPHISPLL
jgi:hypothetical protein